MRKFSTVIALIVIGSSVAFSAGPIGFGLQATGANLNVSGLTDVYGFGFGGGGHLDFSLPILFSFRLQGDYVRFSPDAAKYAGVVFPHQTGISVQGGDVNMISGHVSTKMSPLPLPLISPYLTAGVGITKMDVGGIQVKGYTGPIPTLASGTSTSANAGVGVDVNLIVVSLYLETRYTWIFADGGTSTYVPVSLGITF